MNMNMEDAEKALKFLNKETGGLQCPMCRGRFFDLAPVELQLLGFKRENTTLSLEGQVNFISIVTATCEKCGFVANFNLKTMGVVK